jgi:hypothetical protein
VTDMIASNGVIRVGRKGLRKFAIGEEDDPRKLPTFEVDVVAAFQQWIAIDDGFRPPLPNDEGNRPIPTADMAAYHQAAVGYVAELGGGEVTTAEALDFIARLREQYDELADFFQPKLREKRASPDTSEGGSLRFSVEGTKD